MAGPDGSRGSSCSSDGMPFIISSNVEKVDPATRQLIRSHVMQGKKKKRSGPNKAQRMARWAIMDDRSDATPFELEEAIKAYAQIVPDRVGSDTSFIEFADEIEPSMRLNMMKC